MNRRDWLRVIFLITICLSILSACNNSQVESDKDEPKTIANSTNKVVLNSEVKWTPLNPARGDKSPQAGTLWGDRNGSEATGFLVKFVDGFSSPPHIHNVTYRGVVINGTIHNDDPKAENMWMPVGSFWTQPAGESHITSAKGTENIAYIEIDKGPYLVRPVDKAFDNGERPVNVDASNIVWVNPSEKSASDNKSKRAFLWGNPQDDNPNGNFIKLLSGFNGKILSQGSSFHGVVIKGQPQYQMPNEEDTKTLEPGSYFSSEGESVHQISCKTEGDCIIYVRTNGKFDVTLDK